MNRTMRTLAAAALAAVLAGCGTATHPASAPAPGPVPTASAANVQTCQDYAKQRAWIKAHEATLTLVDIATIGGWIETDSGESTGRLHTDMTSESAGYERVLSNAKPAASQSSAHLRVATDCTAIGVKVS